MTKNTSTSHFKARRKHLKNLMVGGSAVAAGQSLPDNWIRPTISTAVLPVHAGTTTPGTTNLCPSSSSFAFSAEGLNDSEQINVSLEFQALNVPAGSEVVVVYDSELDLQELGNSYTGTINADGFPVWETTPVSDIEVFGTPIGAEVTAEIQIEGCDQPVELTTVA